MTNLTSEHSIYSLIRVFDTKKEKLIEHLLSLDTDDRYLRFAGAVSNHFIEGYVSKTVQTQNTRNNADFWYAITLPDKSIVATLHIAIKNDIAEFALTTDKNHRGKKLGQLLFARGYQLVTEYNIEKIYLTFLNKNKPIQHIAKKFGLSISQEGTEVDAYATVNYPVPMLQVSIIKDILGQSFELTESLKSSTSINVNKVKVS